MTQIANGYEDREKAIPVVHTVELLDWVSGGPMPEALARARFADLPSTQSAA
jgi:glycolate oxidase iron-sulfur subunit